MQLHYSLLCLSGAVLTANALVPFPLEERQIGQSCSTPVTYTIPLAPAILTLILIPHLISIHPSLPPHICFLSTYLYDFQILTEHVRTDQEHAKTQPTAQRKAST